MDMLKCFAGNKSCGGWGTLGWTCQQQRLMS